MPKMVVGEQVEALVDEEDALYEDEAPLDHTRNNEAKTQWKISIEKIKENYEAYEAKSNCSNNNNEVY